MHSSTLPSTSELEGGDWSTPRPGSFTLRTDPVPTVQEAGWAAGPGWTGAKNLFPTGIPSPDRPARSQSLCRLSCPGPLIEFNIPYEATEVAEQKRKWMD